MNKKLMILALILMNFSLKACGNSFWELAYTQSDTQYADNTTSNPATFHERFYSSHNIPPVQSKTALKIKRARKNMIEGSAKASSSSSRKKTVSLNTKLDTEIIGLIQETPLQKIRRGAQSISPVFSAMIHYFCDPSKNSLKLNIFSSFKPTRRPSRSNNPSPAIHNSHLMMTPGSKSPLILLKRGYRELQSCLPFFPISHNLKLKNSSNNILDETSATDITPSSITIFKTVG